MPEVILIICALISLIILFRPRREPYVRRVTRSYNGRPYGKEQEPY
jgi:hypothetical protein